MRSLILVLNCLEESKDEETAKEAKKLADIYLTKKLINVDVYVKLITYIRELAGPIDE